MAVPVLKGNEFINKAFSPLSASDMASFEPFRLSSSFGDTAFSMLYAWSGEFDYRCRFYGNLIAVMEIGINGERAFSLIRRSKDISIDKAVNEIFELCCKADVIPCFEYISESELNDYIFAVEKIGQKPEISFVEECSDYIYRVNDYISISGNKNKSKRGGYNFLIQNYPDLKYLKYSRKLYGDCMEIFDKWCSVHKCENCFYGCEFRTFKRFMDVYDPKHHLIGLSYNGNAPLSFAVFEKINKNTVCCYFQKNSEKIRGLTYWLSRQMLSEFENIEYLNLGEDMGIAGIITDKSLLHPCQKLKKYTVKIL